MSPATSNRRCGAANRESFGRGCAKKAAPEDGGGAVSGGHGPLALARESTPPPTPRLPVSGPAARAAGVSLPCDSPPISGSGPRANLLVLHPTPLNPSIPNYFRLLTQPRCGIAATGAALLIGGAIIHSLRQEQSSQLAGETLTIVPITSLPGIEQHATFSPDGTQVAFAWNGEVRSGFDIYVKLVEGGNALRLTDHPGDDIMPAWSPDGKSIAFWRNNHDQSGIYLVAPLGGPDIKVFAGLPEWDYRSQLAWSRDGKWLAFADPSRRPWHIKFVAPETGQVRTLTSPPADAWGDFLPAFSPDGQSLAFARRLAAGRFALLTLDMSAGRSEEVIMTGTSGANSEGLGLAWSPTDELLVSARVGGGILRVSLSGETLGRIPEVGVEAIQPVISPDGKNLAYALLQRDYNILRVDIDSANSTNPSAKRLITSTRDDVAPQISPDGRRIAFRSTRTGQARLWICNSDGSDPVELGPGAGSPRWSPDGRRIAFDRLDSEVRRIYAIDSAGGSPRAITAGPHSAAVPSWSHDGEWIYFMSDRSGERQVWKTRSAPGAQLTEPAQVTHSGGERSWESGGFLFFQREGDIWRIPTVGGKESVVRTARDLGLQGWTGVGSLPYWTVWGSTHYFFSPPDPEETQGAARWWLKKFNIDTGLTTKVVPLPKEPAPVNGLSVARDGTWFVYVVDDSQEQDLMRLENFR